jgi:hypothetical protein
MIFNTIIFLFPLFTTLLSINNIQVEAGGMQYQFHKDAAGQDNCEKARDDQEELETFKLYCVNKVQSFQLCSLTCSDALHFEGSVGDCRDYECNFYDYTFQDNQSNSLNMNKLAKNKATLFAVVPLWESQAQYFYELMEEVRKDFKQDTEAFLLPMLVDPDGEDATIQSFHTQRVTILNNTSPNVIARHPLLGFLQTLRHKSGFRDFNVYTDRPVLFIISPDGRTVERLVVPTYQTIAEALEHYGIEKESSEKDEEL